MCTCTVYVVLQDVDLVVAEADPIVWSATCSLCLLSRETDIENVLRLAPSRSLRGSKASGKGDGDGDSETHFGC